MELHWFYFIEVLDKSNNLCYNKEKRKEVKNMAKTKIYTYFMKNGDIHKIQAKNFKQATDGLREAVYHAPQIDAHGDTVLNDLVDNWIVEEC